MRRKSILERLLLLAMMGVTQFSIAQGNGIGGVNEVTCMVTSYFDPATKLTYAIGAVVGLIGGVKVYNEPSSGDPDTSKTAASWLGVCIFLIVAATILRSLFSQIMKTKNSYSIDKGIGRSIEFKRLKVQYLSIFVGGLLSVLILVTILYAVGINFFACLGVGVSMVSLAVWQTFSLS